MLSNGSHSDSETSHFDRVVTVKYIDPSCYSLPITVLTVCIASTCSYIYLLILSVRRARLVELDGDISLPPDSVVANPQA